MRKSYIDILKIISAYCVVLLHSTAYVIYDVNGALFEPFVFLNSLTRFAVPVFFLCSGAVILESDTHLSNMLKRAGRILLPLIFWSFVLELYLIYHGVPKNILVIFDDILHDQVMYHMWFLYSILGIYLLIPFLNKAVIGMEAEDWKWFWLLSLTVISAKTTFAFFDSYFPGSFTVLPTFLVYIVAGYYVANFNFININAALKMGGVGLSALLVAMLSVSASLSKGQFVENFMVADNLFIFIGSLLFFDLIKSFNYVIKNDTVSRNITNLSKATYFCYLTHVVPLDILYSKIYHYNYYTSAFPLLSAILLSVLVFVICMQTGLVLKKIPLFNKVI